MQDESVSVTGLVTTQDRIQKGLCEGQQASQDSKWELGLLIPLLRCMVSLNPCPYISPCGAAPRQSSLQWDERA